MKRVKKSILALTMLATATIMGGSIAHATVTYPDGGKFNYGVKKGSTGKYFAYSYYYHGSKWHYSNAMMNGQYAGRAAGNPGETSCAHSPGFKNINCHNEFYGF